MYDLIIFDCDGTLTDTEYANNQGLLDIVHEEGLTQYTIEHVYKHWLGQTNSNIFLMIQMETGKILPADMNARIMRRTLQLQEGNLRAIEGAAELVAAAKKKFKICVASNGERSMVLGSLTKTGLIENFTEPTVFTKIQVKNGKPFPDLFLHAAAQMDVPPERCLVIEDSVAGVTAGVAAGMAVWGFSGSRHDPQEHEQTLKSVGAHLVFERLIHIQDKLGL